MNKTNRCSHCGKVLPTTFDVAAPELVGFCDHTCAWFANERATRRMGSLRRDADGDWQEDPDGDFGADHW